MTRPDRSRASPSTARAVPAAEHSPLDRLPAEAASPVPSVPGGEDSGRACWYCGRAGRPLTACCDRHPGRLACADVAGCRDYLIARETAGLGPPGEVAEAEATGPLGGAP
jgi:hypothetical protein